LTGNALTGNALTGNALTGRRAAPNRQHVEVLVERCVGCQECVVRCPTGALSMDARTWTVTGDDARCVACRQCERICPFAAVTVTGSPRVGPRTPTGEASLHGAGPDPARSVVGDLTATRPALKSWDEAILEASRCLSCPDPTCVRGCPAHNDIPAFVAALFRRDAEGAQEILRRTTVLPDICSLVCDQGAQCEGACSWALAGEDPVAIGLLERFACDQAPVLPPLLDAAARDVALRAAAVQDAADFRG
jgi:glutamate synthase (NADPH/NADH) small chain